MGWPRVFEHWRVVERGRHQSAKTSVAGVLAGRLPAGAPYGSEQEKFARARKRAELRKTRAIAERQITGIGRKPAPDGAGERTRTSDLLITNLHFSISRRFSNCPEPYISCGFPGIFFSVMVRENSRKMCNSLGAFTPELHKEFACFLGGPANGGSERMSTITITVRHVDGSMSEFEMPGSLLADLRRLRGEGYEGRRLIHALLTDDWGPPPRFVDISGEVDGRAVAERIPYD